MTAKLRKIIGVSLALILITLIGFSTKYVSGADVSLLEKGVKAKIDSLAFANENYESKILPYILTNAKDLKEIADAIKVDPSAAGAKYGNRDGDNAAYSVATTFTAVAGELKGDLLVLEVEGVDTKLYLQVGPAINGTAIRDVSGLVSFGMFDNQLAYQDAGTKLNDKVRDLVLSKIDKTTLSGKTLKITGAFSLFNLQQYAIVPVVIEVVE
jgi:predicted lipoprotein